jgi:hypothetical protein
MLLPALLLLFFAGASYVIVNIAVIHLITHPKFTNILHHIFNRLKTELQHKTARLEFKKKKISVLIPQWPRLLLAITFFSIAIFSNYKFRVSFELDNIILWWCVTCAAALATITTLSERAIHEILSHFGFASKLLASLVLGLLFWFIDNEARGIANNLMGIPPKELSAAVTAMTAVLVLSISAVALGVVAFVVEISLIVIPMIGRISLDQLFFRQSVTFFTLFTALLFSMQHLHLPLRNQLYVDVVLYFTLRYDLDDKIACKNPPENSKFMFVDANRTTVLYLKPLPDSGLTITQRLSIKAPRKYFSKIGVLECDWTPGLRSIP